MDHLQAKLLHNRPELQDYRVLELHAPEIAAKAKPGQFAHVRVGSGLDPLLRRPFSVMLPNRHEGTIQLLIKNVGRAFGDGSLRLVRDVPYGSEAWKEIYRRARNGAEGRNATLQGWALKRLPVFGTPRAQATLFLADLWRNLTTMARLVKEATLAHMRQPAA